MMIEAKHLTKRYGKTRCPSTTSPSSFSLAG